MKGVAAAAHWKLTKVIFQAEHLLNYEQFLEFFFL